MSTLALPQSKRLVSLDAFRGLVILGMISGGFRNVEHGGSVIINFFQGQLTHSDWIGLTFHDIIFPAFLFIVGVALPFSYAKRWAGSASRATYVRHVVYRAIVIFLLGSLRTSVGNNTPLFIELSSALQPIAVSYLVAALLIGYSVRVRLTISGLILLLYGIALWVIPTPGVPAGTLDFNHNLIWSVDMAVLGQEHPQGWGTLLLFVPQVVNTMCGTVVGAWLQRISTPADILRRLGLAGTLCLVLGGLSSLFMPSIMKIWTPTYCLVTIGFSTLLLLLFYWLIDVLDYRRWAFPLVVFGLNAIALYMGNSLFGGQVASIVRVFIRDIVPILGSVGPFFAFFSVLFVKWLIFYWMYQRKIFIKL